MSTIKEKVSTSARSLAKRSQLARDIARGGSFHMGMAQRSVRAREAYTRARQVRWITRYLGRRAAAAEFDAGGGIDLSSGFAVLPAGTLDGVDPVVESAHEVIERIPEEALAKTHVTDLLDPGELSRSNPFVEFALRDDLVGPVSRYLGMLPVIESIDVWYSHYTGETPTSSRLWHLDGDDIRQVKVFLNCSNVTAASGPLTVLDLASSATIAKAVDYRLGEPRVPDQTVTALAGDAEPVAFEGPPGTVALVDTSRCFHFGSRVLEGAPPRVLVLVQYVTPFSFDLPGDYRRTAPYRHLAGEGHSKTDEFLLGAR